MQFSSSEFWDFSVHFYNLANVEENCLILQDQHQLDVNLILLNLWSVIDKNISLDKSQWQTLIAIALPWQEIIKPLRSSRTLIKDKTIAWPASFQKETRKTINQLELNAEHMQQLALERCFNDFELTPINNENSLGENIKIGMMEYLNALNIELTLATLQTNIEVLIDSVEHYQENKKTIAQ